MRNPRRIFYAADTLSCFVSSYPLSTRKSPRTKLLHAIRREMLTWQFPLVIARPGGPHAMFSPLRNHVAMCLNTDHRLPPKSPVPSITFRLLVLKGYDKKILLSWFSSVKNNHHHFLDLFHSPSNIFFFFHLTDLTFQIAQHHSFSPQNDFNLERVRARREDLGIRVRNGRPRVARAEGTRHWSNLGTGPSLTTAEPLPEPPPSRRRCHHHAPHTHTNTHTHAYMRTFHAQLHLQ